MSPKDKKGEHSTPHSLHTDHMGSLAWHNCNLQHLELKKMISWSSLVRQRGDLDITTPPLFAAQSKTPYNTRRSVNCSGALQVTPCGYFVDQLLLCRR